MACDASPPISVLSAHFYFLALSFLSPFQQRKAADEKLPVDMVVSRLNSLVADMKADRDKLAEHLRTDGQRKAAELAKEIASLRETVEKLKAENETVRASLKAEQVGTLQQKPSFFLSFSLFLPAWLMSAVIIGIVP